MALQTINGEGLLYPRIPLSQNPPTFDTSLLIDATGEKLAMIGRVWFPSRAGAKNLSRLQFRFGTVTKAGGSALTVSLQDVDATTGPVFRPDETQDQTVAIANADAGFATGTWYRTAALSASRSVSCGDLLAVVVEYGGAGRLGSDSVIVVGSVCLATNGIALPGQCATVLKTGGTWSGIAALPNVLIEFDDGSFGTLRGATCHTAENSHSVASNSTPDEYALVFQVPFKATVDGLWALVAGAGNFDIVLYSGTTPLATVSVDLNQVQNAGARYYHVPIAEQTLTPNTNYYVAVKPTSTTAVTVYSSDVSNASHWTAQDGGPALQFSTRTDAGAWAAATATRRLHAGVSISALDDGVGGGLLTHPGMAGGMRG